MHGSPAAGGRPMHALAMFSCPRTPRRAAPLALTAVTLLLVLASSAIAASPYLSAPAWQALHGLRRVPPPSSARACRSRADPRSAHPEVRAVNRLCLAVVAIVHWTGRFVDRCLGLSSQPTSESACRRAVVGTDRGESALSASAGWFAARLGSGGCRRFFSYGKRASAAVAAAGRPLARDLRGRVGSARLNRDLRHWFATASHPPSALSDQAVARDLAACAPPAS